MKRKTVSDHPLEKMTITITFDPQVMTAHSLQERVNQAMSEIMSVKGQGGRLAIQGIRSSAKPEPSVHREMSEPDGPGHDVGGVPRIETVAETAIPTVAPITNEEG